MLRIVHNTRHDFARRSVFIIGQGQPLQGRKHLLSKPMHHPLLKGVVETDSERITEILQSIGEEQSDQHPGQDIHIFCRDDVINHDLDEPGREQFQCRRDSGKEEGDAHKPAIGRHVGQNSEERFHRKLRNLFRRKMT